MKTQHYGFYAMGTRLDLVLTGIEKPEAAALAQELHEECQRIETLLSVHEPSSPLSLLNHSARTGLVPVDDELREILSEISFYNRLTEGYFDPTLQAEVREAQEGMGWNGVELLPEGVHFAHPELRIDLGGYGKGYAVERMVSIIQDAGVEHALLSFGDSLIYGLGNHPYGEGWPIALPLSGEETARSFLLKDQALSLSGNTFNNQKKFANSGHIVDASSGLTRRESGVVCVMCENPVKAEVFSTSLFGAGQKRGKALEKVTTGLEVKWFME